MATPTDSSISSSETDLGTAALVLGDIGGTNARFEFVKVDLASGNRVAGSQFSKTYPTSKFPIFKQAVRQFLQDADQDTSEVDSVCLACAGPVIDNKCTMTNLDWIVDASEIESEFGCRCAVLNDFVAAGYSIPALPRDSFLAVNDVPRDPTGPVAVLGPGTGLGEVQLMWDSGMEDYVAWASEGSHATFAPRGKLQRELLEFAEMELESPCEIEHVACGTGLKRIHRFLCQRRGDPIENLEAKDITERALKKDCSTCAEAVELFVEIVGAEAGYMALRSLATGGVYIAGGIPPRILPLLQDGNLQKAFINSRSRFSTVTSRFPLYVLKVEAGLLGVFQYALSLAQNRR